MGALTASGQVYLPSVAITSITVSGTTATVVTSAPHRATAGGKVRIAGTTVAGLNGAAITVLALDGTTPTTKFTYTVASGTSSETGHGTVEPLGTAITMAGKADHSGPTGTWVAPSTGGETRTVEITVVDSQGASSTISHTVSTVAASTNAPPLVAIVSPNAAVTPAQANPATGQVLAMVAIDPNSGDLIASTTWQIKDSTGTVKASGTFTAQTPAVNTTLATAVADVSNLNGDPTDTVTLTSATGTSSGGGVIAVAHGTGSIVVIAYSGVSGNNLTGCDTQSGSGALSVNDVVRSANFTATFDASNYTPGATYTALATATDNQTPAGTGSATNLDFKINQPPVVTWGYPRAGNTVSGTITFAVTVTDDGGTPTCHGGLYNQDPGGGFIGAFVFGDDGSVTYPNYDTHNLADNADHIYRARIVDYLGLVTTADVTFHVDQTPSSDTTGPTITGILPAAGTTESGTIIVGAASITDASGVASATYAIDGGTPVALTASPSGTDDSWTAQLDTTGLTNGTHSIVIAATDAANPSNTTTATAVSFTVANTTSTGPSSDWFASSNPMQQTHDIIVALDSVGRGDALVWATAVGVPIRPAAAGVNTAVVDSQGNVLGVGYAVGDTIPSGSFATSHKAIDPAAAAARFAAHYARWTSTEFYDLTNGYYRTGPWIVERLADSSTGWGAAWTAGAADNFKGTKVHGGAAGRFAGASK